VQLAAPSFQQHRLITESVATLHLRKCCGDSCLKEAPTCHCPIFDSSDYCPTIYCTVLTIILIPVQGYLFLLYLLAMLYCPTSILVQFCPAYTLIAQLYHLTLSLICRCIPPLSKTVNLYYVDFPLSSSYGTVPVFIITILIYA
jgi:hypothetical protein